MSVDKENVIKLIETLIEHHTSYHDHKENMAHAVFLFEVGLFTALFSMDKAPSWIKTIPHYEGLAVICICLVWLILHLLLRWQLRNRRWAALNYAGALNAYRRLLMNDGINEKDMSLHSESETQQSRRVKIMGSIDLVLDFIIPIRNSSSLHTDVKKARFPALLVDEINRFEQSGSTSLFAERILSYSSLLIMLAMVIRLLYTPF